MSDANDEETTMTRDELLDYLRRELSSGEWTELRPDERLSALESRLDSLAEEVAEFRREYDDASHVDILRALDDLAASVSYMRTDVGQLFSDATRLADELRAALRRADDDEAAAQMDLAGTEVESRESSEARTPEQRELFDED